MKQLTGILLMLVILLASCKKENTSTDSKHKMISDSLGIIRVDLGTKLGKIIPSISVLIQTPEETLFASNSQEGEPAITPDTYFRFASNSKNFTSTAILNMYEEGWLDIYDKIVDTIPGTNIIYVPSSEEWDIPFKNQITIEQLLESLNHPEVLILDVRTSESWKASDYKIKGAARKNPENFDSWANEISKNKYLVLY